MGPTGGRQVNFQEENNALMEGFFERTFYRGFKDPGNERFINYRSLEIILNYKCNLGCKYCYVHKFGDELYPLEYQDEETILKSLGVLLRWIKENGFDPKIEVFSGAVFAQDIGFKALHMILDVLKGNNSQIVVPTNFTFLLSDVHTKRVEELMVKSREQEMPIVLSASFDGKYCEMNRPFRGTIEGHGVSQEGVWTWKYNDKKDPRDDGYYDRCFAFAKKWNCGFHPMVYSNGIELWKDNFLWFQEQYEKFGLRWQNLYLLEVRNVEWSPKQIKEYCDFIEFLIRWSYEKCECDFAKFKYFLFAQRGFNILHASLSTIGRGIGCSIQSTLVVRSGDLAIVPCHRTCYPHLIYGKFRVEGDRIVGIDAQNPELMIAVSSLTTQAFPYCETCIISSLCPSGCLGSQLEVTGDMFTPIPTVCKLYHAKIKTLISVFKDLGIYEGILDSINPVKRKALIEFERAMKEVKV